MLKKIAIIFIFLLKCLKKIRKNNNYNFFLPSNPLATFTKCNDFTNNNQLKKTNIFQVQLTIVV